MSILASFDAKHIHALDNDQLRTICPAAFTTESHPNRSARYCHFNTHEVIESLRERGFVPAETYRPSDARVAAAKARGHFVDTREHLVRFRHEQFLDPTLDVGGMVPEIVIHNSHDGRTPLRVMGGIFRKVCSNGLMMMETGSHFNIYHKGNRDMSDVFRCVDLVYNDISRILANVEEMGTIHMTEKERLEFAQRAAEMRYGLNSEIHRKARARINASQNLLTVRRPEDAVNNLNEVYNVVQENLIRGGQTILDSGLTMRPITQISENIRVNAELWNLAQEYRRKHATAA